MLSATRSGSTPDLADPLPGRPSTGPSSAAGRARRRTASSVSMRRFMGSSSATTSGTRFSSSQARVVPDRGSPVTSTFPSSTSGPGYGTGRGRASSGEGFVGFAHCAGYACSRYAATRTERSSRVEAGWGDRFRGQSRCPGSTGAGRRTHETDDGHPRPQGVTAAGAPVPEAPERRAGSPRPLAEPGAGAHAGRARHPGELQAVVLRLRVGDRDAAADGPRLRSSSSASGRSTPATSPTRSSPTWGSCRGASSPRRCRAVPAA